MFSTPNKWCVSAAEKAALYQCPACDDQTLPYGNATHGCGALGICWGKNWTILGLAVAIAPIVSVPVLLSYGLSPLTVFLFPISLAVGLIVFGRAAPRWRRV